jgi:acyl-CoA synthetase (AMP-forming)/AMP-acid ligase II
LLQEGLGGEPVAIVFPPGTEFVAVFLACLSVGAIAIPAPYPDMARNVERLTTILGDARPTAIITDAAGQGKLAAANLDIRVIDADRLSCLPASGVAPGFDPGHPAFVQYTSGSTRLPKGIVVTHANLVANQRMIAAAFGLTADSIVVSWLPHFHDMGLIGTILQPLFLGATTVLMPPRAFIQKPLRWLRAIDTWGGTTAGGPCFAFDLCTRMIPPDQAAQLDLTRWSVAFCGSEPVRASVLEQFAARFRSGGFRAEAFLPCYGLAEATLIASSVPPGLGYLERALPTDAGDSKARRFVSCGAAVRDSTIVLRDVDGRVRHSPDGRGEICISGPHVSPGRWDGTRRTVVPFPDTFTCDGQDFLPTGDIGVLSDGELFPIDRLSDTIIVYGANIHAADVEATILDDPGAADVRAAAAFAADDGSREKLVVLCELERRASVGERMAVLEKRLASRVAEAHGILPQIGLVAYGSLPRTSSGKIQRRSSRTEFLSGRIKFLSVAQVSAGQGPDDDSQV